jgi:hypothetical protein
MQAPSFNQASPQTEFPGGTNSPSNPSPVAPVATETDSVQLAVLERSVLPKDKVSLSGEPQDKSKTLDKESKADRGEAVSNDERSVTNRDKVLSEQQEKELIALQARDAEVKAHERAHKAVGGQYAGSISYDYQQGPNGKRYAVGGEVSIDVSPVSGDPEKTIEKMNVIKAAALAPADPSSQDRRVAAQAAQIITAARAELNAPKENEDKTVEDNDASSSNLRINQRSLSSYNSVSELKSEEQNVTRQFVDDIA